MGGETTTATRFHRFWVESLGEWVEAVHLESGMVVLLADGSTAIVESVNIRELTTPDDTFNLVVETNHNYFVGELRSVLVHNGTPEEEARKRLNDQLHTVYRGDDGYTGITNDIERRQVEWRKEGREITPIHEVPDRETARGVEQIEVEQQRAPGNPAALEQNNSIDPKRTDERAVRMREKGKDYIEQKKANSGGC